MIKRSKTDSIIGGVCGGIAEATDTSALAWRIIFVLAPIKFLDLCYTMDSFKRKRRMN